MKLEESIKILEKMKNSYLEELHKKEILAIETVLKEIEYIKNDEQKAMEILKQNSIGRYKKEENGTISHIIAVEDLKKILHLIDTQEIKLKNSISKKEIENKIEYLEIRKAECDDIESKVRLDVKINAYKELLEDK